MTMNVPFVVVLFGLYRHVFVEDFKGNFFSYLKKTFMKN